MSKRKFPLRVIKGGFAPADRFTAAELRERGYHIGDLVYAEMTKPRNPKFNRLVHAFGNLIRENIGGFEYLDAHKVLKRLQIEAGIGCDEIGVVFPGIGPATYRIPKSLSFESMDDGAFKEVFSQFCKYVSDKYWPSLTAEQIADMAELMGE